MSNRKKVKLDSTQAATVQYMNKFAQVINLISPRKLYCELGRGSAKTTDIQTERLMDIIYDMPGAPCVWVADTFTNLSSNILPTVLEALERKGLREGIHYVVEKEPPRYTDKEKESLPDWLRPHFWKPFNKLVTYKRTIVFFTGLNIRFGSLDRPSTLAGSSYVYVFGDEAKYFQESKIANLLKAVRGYRAEYGHSVYYRGLSFTSDVANPNNIGEYTWMSKYVKVMDVDSIMLVAKAGLVYNDALRTYVAEKDNYIKTRSAEDLERCRRALRIANDWRAKWIALRKQPANETFYIRTSSYVNVDILTADWFRDAIEGNIPDLKTAILSMRPQLESGERFYSALNEKHFYFDGIDESAYDEFGLLDQEDCRVLRYLDPDRPLRLGVDFGNMCSMVCGQEGEDRGTDCIRVLKFLYTLAPAHIPELGAKFRAYFAPMRNKTVQLYYDRAGNAYRSIRRSNADDLKHAIETDGHGHRTGWVVQLMSIGQATILQSQEYTFMMKILSESNPRLPVVRIDAYAAKELKASLQLARTKVKDDIVYKDKRSERLPVEDLPMKSTNPSDAFKYFLMDRRLTALASGKTAATPGNIDPIFTGRK